MNDDDDPASDPSDPDLKSRIFAAFEHACRYGEVEVADDLLAIINAKWIKPLRTKHTQMPGATHAPGTIRPFMTSR